MCKKLFVRIFLLFCDTRTNVWHTFLDPPDMTNFEQSGSRIPEAESVKVTLSLRVTSYLTKTENRTKELKSTALTILPKKTDFLQKISKIILLT